MHSVLDITEIPVSDEPGLWYPVQQETLEIFEFTPIPADDSETSLRHTLVSHWGGEYTFDTTRGIRLVYLNITSVDSDGTILGAGTDVYGRFKILGKVDGDQVNFVKEYLLLFQGEITKWACEASLSEELDCMKGVWRAVDDQDPAPSTSLSADPTLEESNTIAVTSGLDIEVPNPSNNGQPEDDGTSQTFNDTANGTGDQRNDIPACGPADGLVAAAIDDGRSSASVDDDRESVDDDAVSVAETESIVGGAFKLMRRPVEWFLCQPPVDESDKKSPKSLWKFAIAATRHQVQSRSPHWSYIQIRRRQRHRFMELRRRWNSEGNWNAVEERDWLDLVRTVHAEDRALWKAMMEFKDRRDAVHSYVAQHFLRVVLTIRSVAGPATDVINSSTLPACSVLPAGRKQQTQITASTFASTAVGTRRNSVFATTFLIHLTISWSSFGVIGFEATSSLGWHSYVRFYHGPQNNFRPAAWRPLPTAAMTLAKTRTLGH
jgi:hypothetical protein